MFDINYRKKLNDNRRICICDDYAIPKYCKDGCDEASKITCDNHTNLKCPVSFCKKYFHKGCIASHKRIWIEGVNSNHLLCMECDNEQSGQNIQWSDIGRLNVAEKLERMGIICPSDQNDKKKLCVK